MDNCTLPSPSSARKNRTVIVYFGVFLQYIEIIGNKARYICIVAAAMAKATVEHKEGCTCSKGYTWHRSRKRTLKNFRGESYEAPIWQIRCKECGAVFTVLPSFMARYQRWDVDALSKLLEINLVMTSSYRHTFKILEYAQGEELAWNPERILHIVHWLSDLLPLPSILLRLGLTPPQAVLEDEKFVRENGEKTYVAFVSCNEVIWWIEYLKNTDEISLEASFRSYRAEIREVYPDYDIDGVTYDGWKPAKAAFEAVNINVVHQECHLHAKKRMSKALRIIERNAPSITEKELTEIKESHDQILEAESRASYSQRSEYDNLALYEKECSILKALTTKA